MNKFILPEKLLSIIEKFNSHGAKAYLVGGSVRDMLMNLEVKDYDLASSLLPEEVFKIFKKVIPTGLKHGTVTIVLGDFKVEVTTFRAELDYIDGRRPSKIEFIEDLFKDLERRDFTINAIAYDPFEDIIYDPFAGEQDISLGIIRAVGSADVRFSEDHLRMLRALRFASSLGFNLHEDVFYAIVKNAFKIKNISKERINAEFCKILTSKYPIIGLSLAWKTGLLFEIFDNFKGYSFEKYIVNLNILNAVSSEMLGGRLFVFLSDFKYDLLEAKLKLLCFSNIILKRLSFLFANFYKFHSFFQKNFQKQPKNVEIARLLRGVSRDLLDELLEVLKAYFPSANSLFTSIKDTLKTYPSSIKDLNIDGTKIVEMGYSGAEVREVLEELLTFAIGNPEQNQEQNLLQVVKKYKKK